MKLYCVEIRHPEELSLARHMQREELKKNRGVQQRRQQQPHSPNSPAGGGYRSSGGGSPDGTLGTMWRTSNNTPSTPVVRKKFVWLDLH